MAVSTSRLLTVALALTVALLAASARFRGLLKLILLAATLGLVAWAALTVAAIRLVAQRRAGRAAIRLPRPLAHAATPAAWEATLARYSWQASDAPTKAALHPQLSPSVNAAVDGLLELVLREFVHDWLDRITGQGAPPSFPNAIETLVRHALGEVIVRAERVDWTAFAVAKLVPRATEHLDRFKAAEASVRGGVGGKASGATGGPVDDMLLASAFARDGRGGLHTAVDVAGVETRPAEEAHLRAIMARILPLVLPPNEAGSGAVVAMAREIVACTISLPLIQMLTDPDFLNKLVDEKAGAAIREQQLVAQFREALDAAPSKTSVDPYVRNGRKSSGGREISASTTPHDFNTFLRSIKTCSSLVEARRLRNDVETNLRRARLADDAQPLYIERLERALRYINRRTIELGGADEWVDAMAVPTAPSSLREVLGQPEALSVFVEWMGRRRRAASAEFWLTVEGLRDPLGDAAAIGGELDATSEDVRMLCERFFADDDTPRIALVGQERHIDQLRRFAAGEAMDIGAVKQSVAALQQAAYEEMEASDWPDFVRSGLYAPSTVAAPAPVSAQSSSRRTLSQPDVLSSLPSSVKARIPSDSHTPHRPAHVRRISALPAGLVSPKAVPKQAVLQRTDTAPPQVTLKPAFDLRRIADSEAIEATPDRWGKVAPSTDSLQFLIGPTAIEDRAPLFEDEGGAAGEDDWTDVRTIEAIQDALTSILAAAGPASSSSGENTRQVSQIGRQRANGTSSPLTASTEIKLPEARPAVSRLTQRQRATSDASERTKLTTASASRRRIFDDEDEDDSDTDPMQTADGDDGLANAALSPLLIDSAKLTQRIETLRGQEDVIDALLRKADLTGNTRERKLLLKSGAALRREIRALEFQREQQQRTGASTLADLAPGQVRVAISHTTVGQAGPSGRPFVLYLVEVHQTGDDGLSTAGWFVTRRYSEFATLDQALRERIRGNAALRRIELPGKRLVTSMSSSFVDQRRHGLEKYLQAMIKIPAACQSPELRAFLSQANISLPQLADAKRAGSATSLTTPHGIVRSIYRSVAIGIDDLFAGPALVEALIQRLTQQADEYASGGADEDALALRADAASATSGGELTAFTAPLCDLLVELFHLRAANQWLRRQAVLIILQQVLGGTIERKLREGFRMALSTDSLLAHIATLRDGLFPNGRRKPPTPPRTALERAATRDAAQRKLAQLIPTVGANVIGRSNAKRAARTLFAVLQHRRLTASLLYTVIDDVLAVLFPELP